MSNYIHPSTEKAMSAVREMLNSAVVFDDEKQRYREKYSPEVFNKKAKDLNERFSSLVYAAREAIDEAQKTAHARVDQVAAGALSVGDAEEDFKILSLPVTLSPAELRLMVARHPGNVLFARAVAQYASNHGYTDRAKYSDLLNLAFAGSDIAENHRNIDAAFQVVRRYCEDDRLDYVVKSHFRAAFQEIENRGLLHQL